MVEGWHSRCYNGKTMKRDYEIIGRFKCNGKHLLIVSVNGNIHIMERRELKKWFGRLHMERWAA